MLNLAHFRRLLPIDWLTAVPALLMCAHFRWLLPLGTVKAALLKLNLARFCRPFRFVRHTAALFRQDLVCFARLPTVRFLTVRFMERILESLGKRLSDVWVMLICLVSVGASLGFGSPTVFEALTTPHAHLSLRAAGLWLGERVQEPENLDIIAPRKGGVALFYASGKTFTMGTSQNVASMTMQEIGNLVNAGKANYLLLDNHYMYESPQLESLWTNPNLAQEVGLSLLHREKDDLFQIYTGAVSP